MISVLVFGGVDNNLQILIARVVHDEFSRRGHETEVVAQVVSVCSDRVIIGKLPFTTWQNSPYILVYGVADEMTDDIHPTVLRHWDDGFQKNLQDALQIPVYIIS